jgi:hypothetical protein
VKVYVDDGGEKRLIGRADLSPDSKPVLEVRLFGVHAIICEQFTIGTVTRLPAGAAGPVVERAVLLAPGQPPELLPGWQPLAS